MEIPEGVAEKVADLQDALGGLPALVMDLTSLTGYRSLLPIWIANFQRDIRAVLQAIAEIGGFTQGFILGEGFGRGFLAGFNSQMVNFALPSYGGNPVQPPGIPPDTQAFYNYGSISISAPVESLPALLDALQYAVQQG